MTIIAYTRRSTDRQDTSHEAQLDAIRRATDAELIHIEDDCSGSKPLPEREGGAYALSLLRSGKAEALAALRIDRISRSSADFANTVAEARKQGWHLIVTEAGIDTRDKYGRFLAGVMSNVAELERELIVDRTKDGLAVARKRGKQVGAPGAPKHIKSRIIREHNNGLSLSAISRGLNEDGVATANGGRKWYASAVRSVIQRSSA